LSSDGYGDFHAKALSHILLQVSANSIISRPLERVFVVTFQSHPFGGGLIVTVELSLIHWDIIIFGYHTITTNPPDLAYDMILYKGTDRDGILGLAFLLSTQDDSRSLPLKCKPLSKILL
jgi:hypothetical protein